MAILIFLLVCVLLYYLLPKGVLLYEGLRWIPWAFKMASFPLRPFPEKKMAYGSHKRQYFLWVKPQAGQESGNLVVVYIHGGGWQFGHPEMFRSNAQVLAAQGYPVFMLSHRRIPFFDIRHMREDLVAGMSKIEEVIRVEGLNGRKLVLGGASSGSNLASLMAFDPVLKQKMNWNSDKPAGVFLVSPPLNLGEMWQSPPLLLLAGRRKGDRFKLANPIELVEKNLSFPVLIIHGTHDSLVNYRSVKAFYEKVKREGAVDVRLFTLPGGTHLDTASWCFPEHPAHAMLLRWLRQIAEPAQAKLQK